MLFREFPLRNKTSDFQRSKVEVELLFINKHKVISTNELVKDTGGPIAAVKNTECVNVFHYFEDGVFNVSSNTAEVDGRMKIVGSVNLPWRSQKVSQTFDRIGRKVKAGV